MKPKTEVLVAYVASPHAGYLKFFRKYEGRILYILGGEFLEEHPSLLRHLPGNTPEEAREMIAALSIMSDVRILTRDSLSELRGQAIVMPDEDVSRLFAAQHLSSELVSFDGTWRLRWDWGAAKKPNLAPSDVRVSFDECDRALMQHAVAASKRSPDWWRQVGALLARDGKPLFAAYNTHMPSEQSAYLEGDPRSNFGPGECIDASLALHGEVAVLMEAASRGISTAGCDMYVTTFPCPPCAGAIAHARIRRLYFAEGYSLIAGADALASRGVETVKVDL